jgi:hypothetical protein
MNGSTRSRVFFISEPLRIFASPMGIRQAKNDIQGVPEE